MEDRNYYYDVEIEGNTNKSKKERKPKFIPKQHDLRRRSNSEITNKKQKFE